jgi:hypothetical protein
VTPYRSLPAAASMNTLAITDDASPFALLSTPSVSTSGEADRAAESLS